MDEGHVVVDSIAKHGSGDNVYLIRFHYLPAGAWDVTGRRAARRSR
jgi:hypothetical protein